MIFHPVEMTDKSGNTILLRNAEETDAEELIRYLKTTSAETPFLVREPEEIILTVEQEREFLRGKKESERELMLIAIANGKHIGNCSVMQLGTKGQNSVMTGECACFEFCPFVLLIFMQLM